MEGSLSQWGLAKALSREALLGDHITQSKETSRWHPPKVRAGNKGGHVGITSQEKGPFSSSLLLTFSPTVKGADIHR